MVVRLLTWGLVLAFAARSRAETTCVAPEDFVYIDFSSATNPDVGMEWTDADGTTHNSSANAIPTGGTDGAFPGGGLRWKNVGHYMGNVFDIIVTVSDTSGAYWDDSVYVEYTPPVNIPQAVMDMNGRRLQDF